MKYFLRSFSLLLIQEGQLSVSSERICTILVYRIEDLACQVKVWLDKLTTLDMTNPWVDWAVKPQHKQTNNIQRRAIQKKLVSNISNLKHFHTGRFRLHVPERHEVGASLYFGYVSS